MRSTQDSAGIGATVPRVVLVPGLGLDERSSARLRQRIRGTVLILPGMGARRHVGTLDALAGELLAGLPAGPVVLVGHSQSCQVVVASAQRDDRVVAVVLLGPTTDPRMLRVSVLARRWLRTALREPVRQAPRVLAQWLRTGPRAMRALWRQIAADRIDLRLRRVRVRVLVVRGTVDALCPHDWAVHLAACAPGGRLVELPGAAHLIPQTRPDDVARLIGDVVGLVPG